MKKLKFTLILLASFSVASAQNTADLNGVTFGFGAGYSHTFDKTYDYTLTTDANHNLKIQPLSKNAFVISSVVMVKLGKIAADPQNSSLIKQSKKSEYDALKTVAESQSSSLYDQIKELKAKREILKVRQSNGQKQLAADFLQIDSIGSKIKTNTDNVKTLNDNVKNLTGASFIDHLSVNLALNLVNISQDVQFNKNIDGGLGLGYFLTDNLQLALFYDVSRVSQLRDYVVKAYQDKPIPNGDGTNYNALDTKDNNLFYNKTVSGLSFKLVFSIANKKPASDTGK